MHKIRQKLLEEKISGEPSNRKEMNVFGVLDRGQGDPEFAERSDKT